MIGFVLLGMSFGVVGVFVTSTTKDPAALSPFAVFVLSCVESLIAAYSSWSMFWGVPRAWQWWWCFSIKATDTLQAIPLAGLLLPAFPVIALILTFYIPITLGSAYGFLGGGFYESAKCKRIVSNGRAHLSRQNDSRE